MTIGFWAYISIFGFLALIAVLVIAFGILGAFTTRGPDRKAALGFSAAGIAALLIIAAISAFALYPYHGEYHSWREHHGTVADVSSRLLSANHGSDQKFVIRFRGDSQLYGVNDTRAALIKTGDRLSIVCLRKHQWGGGVDGYDCRWNS